ncbi:MAG TPA: DegT/DnrJ/EryC1/StrS family aminotransferase [Syntrophorhabdaceae bacterium]|nr:DegT/DnrJ/EryC1/StrS family aminotransferase [Syntrophorhabdaceae bacterium]
MKRVLPFARPAIGESERKAVADVLDGPILVHGPKAKEFESSFADYTGSPYAVSVSSCTAALHLSYFYLGLQEKDEVIVPAMTHVATAHAVELCGAKPIFVDAEKNTGNIDTDLIEPVITNRTRAISVVHYLGMPVNMEKIKALAEKYGLFVVEDCALAVGTYFKGVHAGLHGDTGCFSFYPVKHMTTAEGGMLISKKAQIVERIQRQKAFGVDRTPSERSIPGVYDVTMLGFNYRMNEIEAAIGIEQVKRLNGFLEKRKENYEALAKGLQEIDEIELFQSSGGDYQSSYYCQSALLKRITQGKRYEVVKNLNNSGVGTSIYYPRPVPYFSYYRDKYGYNGNEFKVAAWISDSSIALPVGPHLNLDDMDYIIEQMKNAIMEVKKHG